MDFNMKVIGSSVLEAVQATLKGIMRQQFVIFKPKDERSVSEIVSERFILPEGGAFDISLVPYMREPLDFIKDRNTHMIIYVSPARTGKTISLLVGASIYIITEDPSDTLFLHITEGTARKFSKITLARAFFNSKLVRAVMPTSGDGNNILQKFFTNGMAFIVGNPAPSNLAGTDYKYVLVSDSDRSPQDNGEGDFLMQADKRTQTFGSAGKCVIESSCGYDLNDPDWVKSSKHEAPPVEGIMAWYNLGDRRVEYWECIECETYFPLFSNYDLFQLPEIPELLKEIETNGKDATIDKYNRIWCPSCGCEITPDKKPIMSETQRWVKEDPLSNNPIKSFWGSGYSAGFQNWRSLVSNYVNALIHWKNTGDETKLRVTMNVDMGAPYTSMALKDRLTSDQLQSRAYDFGDRTIPEQVRYLIATVDTQLYKWVVSIQGIGVNNERYLIDRFDVKDSTRRLEGHDGFAFVQPATYGEDWDQLYNQVITKKYPLGDGSGRVMAIHKTVCDMHGQAGVTEQAYKFAMKAKSEFLLGNKFTLLRGERPTPKVQQPLVLMSTTDKTSSSAVNARAVGKVRFARVNTTIAKDTLLSQLQREEQGANYIHWSKYLPYEVYEETVSEHRTDKGWERIRKSGHNEMIDLLAYGIAAIDLIRLEQLDGVFNWSSPPPYALDHDNNINVFDTEGVSDADATRNAAKKERLANSRNRKR